MSHDRPHTPAWYLIKRNRHDDTANVLCHWHYEPTIEEIEDMKQTTERNPVHFDFYIVFISRQSRV